MGPKATRGHTGGTVGAHRVVDCHVEGALEDRVHDANCRQKDQVLRGWIKIFKCLINNDI